jgi:hypothetical protein
LRRCAVIATLRLAIIGLDRSGFVVDVAREMYVMESPSRAFAMLGYDVCSWIAAGLQAISETLLH